LVLGVYLPKDRGSFLQCRHIKTLKLGGRYTPDTKVHPSHWTSVAVQCATYQEHQNGFIHTCKAHVSEGIRVFQDPVGFGDCVLPRSPTPSGSARELSSFMRTASGLVQPVQGRTPANASTGSQPMLQRVPSPLHRQPSSTTVPNFEMKNDL